MGSKRCDRVRGRNSSTILMGLVMERRAKRQLQGCMDRLESTYQKCVKDLDRQAETMEKELCSFNRNISSAASYFREYDDDDVSLSDDRDVSLQTDSATRDSAPDIPPCVIGESRLSRHQCRYFPCCKLHQYHCMFRITETGSIILSAGRKTPAFPDLRPGSQTTLPETTHSAFNVSNTMSRPATAISFLSESSAQHREGSALTEKRPLTPAFVISADITEKERVLKLYAHKRRLENQAKKPLDRAVNYGKPMSWRFLLRPLRPAIERQGIR